MEASLLILMVNFSLIFLAFSKGEQCRPYNILYYLVYNVKGKVS
jgi:hypothetical protein